MLITFLPYASQRHTLARRSMLLEKSCRKSFRADAQDCFDLGSSQGKQSRDPVFEQGHAQ
jgi:hypothetical protein